MINAISRAVAVLNCFAQASESLSNSAVAEMTGFPRSTVSRIMRTLTELGYLRFRQEVDRYYLGPQIMVLAEAYQRMSPLQTLIRPILQSLADDTRGTVGLGTIEGHHAVYKQVARGVSVIILQVDPGTTMDMLESAMGRALMAGTTGESRTRVIEQLVASGTSAQRVTKQWSEAAAEFEERGYCTSIEEWREAINGIAVPIRFPGESRTYAINIGGPSFVMTEETLHKQHAPRLLKAVEELVALGLAGPISRNEVRG